MCGAGAGAALRRRGRQAEERKHLASRRELSLLRPIRLKRLAHPRRGTGQRARSVRLVVALAVPSELSEQAPDLADKVRSGEMALDRAGRVIRDREASGPQLVRSTVNSRPLEPTSADRKSPSQLSFVNDYQHRPPKR